ncbi:MAG: cysteine hydrolase family protein [Pseudomonadota bacterium]
MENQKALIIIDVLEGIVKLPVPIYEEKKFFENLQIILKKAKDKEIPVIYNQHFTPKGSFFEKGSENQRIHKLIEPQKGDIVIEKHNPDSFHGTNLDQILKEKNINTLYICGFAAEGCIDSTVRSAFSKDYKVILISDCHTTTDTEILKAEQIMDHHNHILQRFAILKKTEEVQF